MSALEKLIENNEFPILFIGSGVSKRYLFNYPSWEELLKEMWHETLPNVDYYGYLNRLENEMKRRNDLAESEIKFMINIEVASYLEEKINEKFYNEQMSIDGLNQEIVYKEKVSPYKRYISNRFASYEINENVLEEIELFNRLLLKAQIILTTNYDSLIEDLYNNVSHYGIEKYIGQMGFYKPTLGYAELYKLHGSIENSNSVVITKEDYAEFDENSILISSKVITLLLHSPIIFIGYSMTDRNVKKILRDFSRSLDKEERKILEQKIIIINWVEGIEEIDEEIQIDEVLGCSYTVINTDNYGKIYSMLSSINQGVSPSEVRRYHKVIKELIITRGKEGTLESVLISPSELDEVEKIVANKNLVVAIGDRTVIFVMPNIVKYMRDYISEEDYQQEEAIMRFIAVQQPKSRIPFIRYINEDKVKSSSLYKNEKRRLLDRIKEHGSLEKQLENITYKIKANSFDEIINSESQKYRQYSAISYNIKKMDLEKVKQFIIAELDEWIETGESAVSTELRRLCLIYDLVVNRVEN